MVAELSIFNEKKNWEMAFNYVIAIDSQTNLILRLNTYIITLSW